MRSKSQTPLIEDPALQNTPRHPCSSCRLFAEAAVAAAAANVDSLARAVQTQAYRTGCVFLNDPLPKPAEVAPLTLLPTPVCEVRYNEVKALAPIFNRLLDEVSCDVQWLMKKLEPLCTTDPWMARLIDLAKEVYCGPGAKQPQDEPRLLLMRQDYLPHCDGSYLQVEINSIAVAFAGMTECVSKIHSNAVRCCKLHAHGKALPDNNPSSSYAEALQLAHETYVRKYNSNAAEVCFYCFAQDHLEIDQSHTQAELERLGVPSFFAILGAAVELRGGNADRGGEGGVLFVDGREVSVMYFHCTYSPEHYSSEVDWENRKRIEVSRAIKGPNLLAHLAGCKKIQEVLSNPVELRRFLSEEDASKCQAVFAQQVDPSTAKGAVADALEAPEKWVLKPQREGGGHNFYGQELKAILQACRDLEQYVLMEKILAPGLPTMLLTSRNSTPCQACQMCISELGIFTAYLACGSTGEVLNTVGGAFLRTKRACSNEGGVCVGAGVLDTPFLIPTADNPNHDFDPPKPKRTKV